MDNIFPNLESAFGGKGQVKDILMKERDVSEKIQYVEISKLQNFKNHIFSPIAKNKFEELKTSIEQNGVLVPIDGHIWMTGPARMVFEGEIC